MVATSSGCIRMKIIVSDRSPAATSDRVMIFAVSLIFNEYLHGEDQFKFECLNVFVGS